MSATATPRVAVVMPCYNQGKYLREAVQSVFDQTFADWELVIVNDGSTDDSEAVAKAVIAENPGRRITLVSQANAGPSAARNRAIAATQAAYILPLDADDRIAPNAVARMSELLDREPKVAIAYCDWDHFGAVQGVRKALEYDFKYLSEKENIFTCTSMFRRVAWEKTGGFKANMNLGLEDWEFWISCGELGFYGKRIPEVLFHYRLKEKSRNTTAQEHYRVMFAQIIANHPRLYPAGTVQAAEKILSLHRVPSGAAVVQDPNARIDALLEAARTLADSGQKREALNCLKDVIALSRSPDVVKRVEAIMQLLKPGSPAGAPGPARPLEDAARCFETDPSDSSAVAVLSLAREKMFEALEKSANASPPSAGLPAELETMKSLLTSSFFTHHAPALRQRLGAWRGDRAIRWFAEILVTSPWRLDQLPRLEQLPEPLRLPILRYLLKTPHCLTAPAEADVCGAHFNRVADAVSAYTSKNPPPNDAREVLECFLASHNCIPLYVAEGNTRPWMQARARLIERFLEMSGCAVDYSAPRLQMTGRKIKVAFISQHFGHQTETYVTAGSLHLDRQRFEISLFALSSNPGPVETYCRSKVDHFHVLPNSVREQVAAIRAAQLDLAIISTNVTAVTNPMAFIAAHRLAPKQVISYCSPMTTGFRHADYFLAGSHALTPAGREHFSEKILEIQGPPGCMDYSGEPSARSAPLSRARFGLAPDEVVFLNAASSYKISHECLDTWCRILSELPASRLVLMPYNPNWTSRFPKVAFERNLRHLAEKHGVAWDRIVIAPGQPTRQAVKDIEVIADVYLDTFPFAGSLAVFDLLELGIPSVAKSGTSFRSNFSAALLREFGVTDLICETTESYVAKALELARNASARAGHKSALQRGFEVRNRATSPELFGEELGRRLLELCTG